MQPAESSTTAPRATTHLSITPKPTARAPVRHVHCKVTSVAGRNRTSQCSVSKLEDKLGEVESGVASHGKDRY